MGTKLTANTKYFDEHITRKATTLKQNMKFAMAIVSNTDIFVIVPARL